ncbi:MAG: Hsp20/alpha crystallin family protein [bacterium]
MDKENFLKSLSMPVDDYRALRKIEAAQKPVAEKKEFNWEDFGEEGQLSVDVYETEDHVVVTAAVAGVKPEDLDVTVTGDMITLRGKRSDEHESSERNYYYRECYFGTFSRTVVLPVHIIGDRADATIKNGFLTVRIPKASNETRIPITETE